MWKKWFYQEAQPSPDGSEGGSGGQQTVEDGGTINLPQTDPPAPRLPDDSAEFTLPDGTVVTYGELRRSYQDRENMVADYTRKTQEAARMRAEAEALRAEADGDRTQAVALRRALAEDLLWYNQHPQAEWSGYKPKVDQILSDGGEPPVIPTTPTSTQPQAPAQTQPAQPSAEAARLEAVERRLDARDREAQVDVVMGLVDNIVGSEGHELVTRKLLLQGVQAHQAQHRGALPDAKRLSEIAKEIQDDLTNAGVPVPRGVVPPDGSRKARPVSDVAATVDPKWKSLSLNRDSRKVEQALANVMREKASVR